VARTFLRETNSPATQNAAAESSGPLLVSSSVFLSSGAQATASSEKEPLIVEAGPSNSISLRALIATRAVEIPNEILRVALAEAKEIPAYTESLTRLFDSWQFGYQSPKTSLPHSTQEPAVLSTPSIVEVVSEQPATLAPAQESGKTPWYHPSVVGRYAIAVLTATLVALRIHNWRSARSTKQAFPSVS
jgi:hypothetical protein